MLHQDYIIKCRCLTQQNSITLAQENKSGVKRLDCVFLYLKIYLNFGTLAQVKHKFILRWDQQRQQYFDIITTRTERKITGEAVTLFL